MLVQQLVVTSDKVGGEEVSRVREGWLLCVVEVVGVARGSSRYVLTFCIKVFHTKLRKHLP